MASNHTTRVNGTMLSTRVYIYMALVEMEPQAGILYVISFIKYFIGLDLESYYHLNRFKCNFLSQKQVGYQYVLRKKVIQFQDGHCFYTLMFLALLSSFVHFFFLKYITLCHAVCEKPQQIKNLSNSTKPSEVNGR